MTRRLLVLLLVSLPLVVPAAPLPVLSPPPASAQATVTVMAAGDISPDPSSSKDDDVATSNLILAANPTAVLTLGDNQYPQGELADFRHPDGYEGSWGRFRARTRPSPGNHDYDDPAGGAAGHNHVYERFGALHPLGRLVAGGAGIRAFTVGTGGNSLYRFRTPPRESSRYRDDGHYGVVRLTLAPTSWRSEFRRTDGQVADQAAAGCWR
jgi:Iron/zinc purple acid phosphatase-like protein C